MSTFFTYLSYYLDLLGYSIRNSDFQQFFSVCLPDFLKLQYPARNDPDKLCHILNMAPGIAAITEKCLTANATLNPEFCMPISILRVRHVRSSYPRSFGNQKPIKSPLRLCSSTAQIITNPTSFSFI